jgi:succinate-acetate transporter protein
MITRYIIKVLLTALIVVGVSEFSKRSTFVGTVMASLPLTSLLAMIWLFRDTQDVQKIVDLSYGIFWIVIPSLAFFVIFPILLKQGLRFSVAMILSCVSTALIYVVYTVVLRKCGIKI